MLNRILNYPPFLRALYNHNEQKCPLDGRFHNLLWHHTRRLQFADWFQSYIYDWFIFEWIIGKSRPRFLYSEPNAITLYHMVPRRWLFPLRYGFLHRRNVRKTEEVKKSFALFANKNKFFWYDPLLPAIHPRRNFESRKDLLEFAQFCPISLADYFMHGDICWL